MTPTELAALKDVILDAIKILGPVGITGFIAYKIARFQFDMKIKQIEKSQEYSARKIFFDLYREKIRKIGKEDEKLSRAMGQTIGYATGLKSFDASDELGQKYIQAQNELLRETLHYLPIQINILRKDVEKFKIEINDEFKRLFSCIDELRKIEIKDTLEVLQKNILFVRRIYTDLYYCQSLIFEKLADDALKKYIDL